MERSERQDKVELYGRGYDMLIEALQAIPREMWKFKPASSEWSVHEVLVHLADSESNAALRCRMLIIEPGGTLMGYDQDKWATGLDYHDQDPSDALETLRLSRRGTYALLKKQPDEVFEHAVRHPQYDDPYTFDKWLDIYSSHIPGHIQQIRNNYKLWRDRHG